MSSRAFEALEVGRVFASLGSLDANALASASSRLREAYTARGGGPAQAALWELCEIVVLRDVAYVREDIVDWVSNHFPRRSDASAVDPLDDVIDLVLVGDLRSASEVLSGHPTFEKLSICLEKQTSLSKEDTNTALAFGSVQIALETCPTFKGDVYMFNQEFKAWRAKCDENFANISHARDVKLSIIARLLSGDTEQAKALLATPYDHWAHFLSFKLLYVTPTIGKAQLRDALRESAMYTRRMDSAELYEVCRDACAGEIMSVILALRKVDRFVACHLAEFMRRGNAVETRNASGDADLEVSAVLETGFLLENGLDLIETTVFEYIDELLAKSTDFSQKCEAYGVFKCYYADVVSALGDPFVEDLYAQALESDTTALIYSQCTHFTPQSVARVRAIRLEAHLASDDVSSALQFADDANTLATRVLDGDDWTCVVALCAASVSPPPTHSLYALCCRVLKSYDIADLERLPSRFLRGALLADDCSFKVRGFGVGEVLRLGVLQERAGVHVSSVSLFDALMC